MNKGFFKVPQPINEPVRSYLPNSDQTNVLLSTYKQLYSQIIEVPQYIGKDKIFSGNKKEINPPHDYKKIVGYHHIGTSQDVHKAIDCALEARKNWNNISWEHRAAIFLKAADLATGKYRNLLNASTMICQSKNVFQAEIDAACELIDFLRFNVHFMSEIYSNQPISSEGIWNRSEYRPLEGFTYAVSPFNFTAIAMNIPVSMAMMGNVVVWKPSDKQMYSAKIIMDLLEEAGLPKGVINMINTEPIETTKIVFEHKDFAGVHFTGSTFVFKQFWTQIGNNINKYKNYPKIVGETGGKDFVLAHNSANIKQVCTGLIRGAFEFQGQKCSAASRAYIPKSIWNDLKSELEKEISTIKVGSTENPSNFVNAVIDRNSFEKCKDYIQRAKDSNEAEIIIGGKCDDSVGYFVHPTIILTSNPKYESMVQEIFGPILTIYIYEDSNWEATLELIDSTSDYALTGAIFSQDRYAIEQASMKLQNCAGNFYINDKPTGAVVGQQPFGGARASGTNDKAGSAMNLLRWVSPRSIKETFVSPESYKYPFLG